jgi:RHS repeat-associated protein
MSKHIIQKRIATALAISAALVTSLTVKAQSYPSNVQVSYVRTMDALAPIQDPNALMARPLKDVKLATQYLDGLGRPIQTVLRKGSMATGATANDLVSHMSYDLVGRDATKYLPFAANNTGGNTSTSNGGLKLNPLEQQQSFLNNQYAGQGESNFYSLTIYEASPLNRPTKSFAPGINWAGTEESNVAERAVQQKYLLNSATDIIKQFSISNASGIVPTVISDYPVGGLYKNITIDEHGKQIVEFKDKEGKVVLKKVQVGNTVTNDYVGWLSTYYIYNEFNQLRFVCSPKATEYLVTNNWQLSQTVADELCFQYDYDAKGRLIKKKVPGAAPVYMVYDARDRIVLTQDGNLAGQGKWQYTQYDEINRPIATGLWQTTLTWNDHINAAANSTTYPTITSGQEELTRNFYDNYNWVNNYGTPLSAAYSTAFNGYFESASNTQWPYPQANVQTNQLKGVITGSRVKVLGTANTYLYTVNFFDEKGRLIQTQATNNAGGIDIVTTQYTWAGQPLVIVQKADILGAFVEDFFHIKTKMQYDDLGRVTHIFKTIYGNYKGQSIAKAEQTIAKNEYNALGQLKTKKLGANNLESLTYDYNIRGWLLGVNREYAKDNSSANNYFGFDLGYDKANNNIIGNQTYANPQYNGNIEGMVWKSKGDGEKRKYDFTYDNANRLLRGDFNQYTSGTFNKDAGFNYDVKMGDGIDYAKAYDANGNILQMQQWGWKMGGSEQIDNMRYTYQTNSNKLKSVVDFNNNINTKLGDFKTNITHPQNATKAALTPSSTPAQFDAIIDYNYDINGNLILDNNKAIGSISYNFLNLPSNTTVTGKGNITYTYDAAGNKLKKVTVENPSAANSNKTITTTTSYVSGFVYESKTTVPANTPNDDYTDKLQFLGHEEGRIRFKPQVGTTAASFQYDYFIKDHLNNTRVVLTEEVQQDIYPAATLENLTFNGGTAISVESQFYTIDNTKIVTQATATGIPTYQNNNGITNNNPYSNTAANSERLYRLDASTNDVPNKTGLGIVLKVMAGDNINVFGKSYHKKPATGYTNTTNPLSVIDIVSLFTATPLITGKATATQITSQSGFPTNVTALLSNQPPQNENLPRASINWIIFDEQFKYVSGGFDMVGTAVNYDGTYKDHNNIPTINIPKNGYIYIYCSNESKYPVFFDNVQVTHNRSALLEESSYYCHGLVMSGISSKAAGKLENKKSKFNGYEYNTDFDINLYESFYRSHDPQIGRFWQLDPKPNYDESLYAAMGNNPVVFKDILGDRIDDPNDLAVANRIVKKIKSKITTNQNSIAKSNEIINGSLDKIASLNNKIASGTLNKKELKGAKKEVKSLEKGVEGEKNKITELTNQNKYLNTSSSDVQALIDNKQYNFKFGQPPINTDRHGVVAGRYKDPNTILIEGSNDGLYVHEIRHIVQEFTLSGSINFSPNISTLGYQITPGFPDADKMKNSEVDAYRAQFAFDSGSFPTFSGASRLSDINTGTLKNINNGSEAAYEY